MPWIDVRISARICLITGAYVRVGDSTSFVKLSRRCVPPECPDARRRNIPVRLERPRQSFRGGARRDTLRIRRGGYDVRPLLPIPPLYSFSYEACPDEARPTMTSPPGDIRIVDHVGAAHTACDRGVDDYRAHEIAHVGSLAMRCSILPRPCRAGRPAALQCR